MTGNDFMSWVLRSPFHGILSRSMMLITVTGCKTGRQYTTPVEYFRKADNLWVLTSRDRTWWRNLKAGAEVLLLVGHKPVTAFAELELDEKAVEASLLEYLQHQPRVAKPLGIRMEHGNANTADLVHTAKDRLFVKIKQIT